MSRRSLTIVGSIVLVAWLAAASGTGERQPPAVSPRATDQPAARDPLTRDLVDQAAALFDRIRAAPSPRQPVRNPFAFGEAVAPRRSAPVPATLRKPEPAALPSIEALPPLKLVGVAENGAGDGVTRKAIIAGLGQLFIVGIGEAVTARYTVTAIGPDVVELADAVSGSPLRIALK